MTYRRYEIAKTLVSRRDILLDVVDDRDRTPLIMAAQYGYRLNCTFFPWNHFHKNFREIDFTENFVELGSYFLQIFSTCSVTMPLRMWSSSWRWYRPQCFALCLETWKSRNGGRYHRCFVRTFEIRFYLQVTILYFNLTKKIEKLISWIFFHMRYFFLICRTVVRRHLRYNWGYGEKLKPIINQFPKDELPKTLKKFLAYEPWKRKDKKTIEISIFIARLFR